MTEKSQRILYLFTSEFPYGIEGETFLETEINYLVQYFSEIWIFPSVRKDRMRTLPPQVRVSDVFLLSELNRLKKIWLLLKNLRLVFRLILSEIKDKGFRKVCKNFNLLFNYLVQQLLLLDKMTFFFKDVNNAVFYDYWFTDKVLALSLLKMKTFKNLRFVSRIHGYDLYDERWDKIGVPFRSLKMEMISKLFVVSSFGKNYLKAKVHEKNWNKIEVSYLGVNHRNRQEKKPYTGKKLIISVARLIPLKNIHLIPLVLKELNEPVYWIHFGDGESRYEVEKNCSSLPKFIQFELRGKVSNVELLEFYRQYKVDLFLSVSDNEGLPVSMMEALSFGIPIVAKPVGGIPEIVVEGLTGFFLPVDNDFVKMADILKKALSYPFSKSEMEKFFLHNFNADNNYSSFAIKLCEFLNE